jgi:hypothetical protein
LLWQSYLTSLRVLINFIGTYYGRANSNIHILLYIGDKIKLNKAIRTILQCANFLKMVYRYFILLYFWFHCSTTSKICMAHKNVCKNSCHSSLMALDNEESNWSLHFHFWQSTSRLLWASSFYREIIISFKSYCYFVFSTEIKRKRSKVTGWYCWQAT